MIPESGVSNTGATTGIGTFDGLGHTINNLTINRPNDDYLGLFGAAGSPAIIRNVGLSNASITGDRYVGGLVGKNLGTISNSHVTGSVTGDANNNGLWIGGLVGWNEGAITDSHAAATVHGNGSVGGLVGYNCGVTASITDSYATGNAYGRDQVGGLVGGKRKKNRIEK